MMEKKKLLSKIDIFSYMLVKTRVTFTKVPAVEFEPRPLLSEAQLLPLTTSLKKLGRTLIKRINKLFEISYSVKSNAEMADQRKKSTY